MMKKLSTFFIVIVAIAHIGFLILEMFLLPNGIGLEIFNLKPEDFQAVPILAELSKNQGLYNGFFAAGLIWSLLKKHQDFIIFLLVCIIIAGIYGAITIKFSILLAQALPAAIALVLVWRDRKKQLVQLNS